MRKHPQFQAMNVSLSLITSLVQHGELKILLVIAADNDWSAGQFEVLKPLVAMPLLAHSSIHGLHEINGGQAYHLQLTNGEQAEVWAAFTPNRWLVFQLKYQQKLLLNVRQTSDLHLQMCLPDGCYYQFTLTLA